MSRFFPNAKRSLDSLLSLITDLVADGLLFFRLLFRSRTALSAEVLFLRKQLAFYEERQVQPRRLGVCCTGCDHWTESWPQQRFSKVPDPTNWCSEPMTYVRVKAVFKRTRLNDLLILGGPLDCTALAKRGYSHLAGDGGFVAKFEWAVGLLTAANTIEEIAHVPGGIGIVGTADDIGF